MLATTSFIRIAALHLSLPLIPCNASRPKDLEIPTCALKPLSCILASIKLSSLVQPCRSPMLIPGVATKVGRHIAAHVGPAMKGKKPSNLLVSRIRQNMEEKAIKHIYRHTYL